MVRSRTEALKKSMSTTRNTPGMCQAVTRGWFDAPSVGDRDGDRDADAVDGWLSEPAWARHPGDRNPPAGVPVAFSGGRRGFGHRAMARGGPNIRSTDMSNGRYKAGVTGNATIAEIERSMGVKYLGWTETISGLKIPGGTPPPKPVKPQTHSVVFGVDLSRYQFQKGFKLELLTPQGYHYVILRCTQGTSYVDPTYAAARAKSEALGLRTAIYHFLEQGNAYRQAQNLARNIVDKSLPVYIDVEPYEEKKSRPTAKDWIEFRDACEKLGLNPVSKYLTSSYWEQIGSPSLVGPLALWRAAYPSSKHDYGSRLYPGNDHHRWNSFGGQTPTLWQFASTGKIDGYKGPVDVNAYRGTLASLDKRKLFKNYGAKAPVPKPTPPKPVPTPAKKSKDFRVILVPGNKAHSVSAIKSDMVMARKMAKGNSAVIFNTERHSAAHRKAVAEGLGGGYKTLGGNENVIAIGSNWKQEGSTSLLKLAKQDPSMAGVSPTRYLFKVPAKNVEFLDAVIKHKGLHLTSEANCVHVKVKGRAWREWVWPIQVNDVLDDCEVDFKEGIPQVLAGDWNTGVKFTGKQLYALFKKRFGEHVVHVHNGSLDQIFVIGTPEIKFEELGNEVVTNIKSDHHMVTALIRVSVR